MFLAKKGKPNFHSSTHNICMSGSSLMEGTSDYSGPALPTQYLAYQVQTSALLAGSGIAIRSAGVGGRTWGNLQANDSVNVDPWYENGKRNILFAWEGYNEMMQTGRTGTQAAIAAGNYATARKNAKGWEVYIILTQMLRGSSVGGSLLTKKAQVDEYHKYLRENYKSMGIAGIVDIYQPNSPFYINDVTNDAEWASKNMYFRSQETFEQSSDPGYLHMRMAGENIVAKFVVQKLRSIGVE